MAELQNVKGLSELRETLLKLPENVIRNVSRGCVAAGAAVIRAEAKVRAPVYTGTIQSGHAPAGTLKRAVSMKRDNKASTKEKPVYHVFVRKSTKDGKVKAQGKFDAYYANWVEFGTSKMAPHPYLRPAFESKKQAAVDAIATYLAARIPAEVEKSKR